MISSPTVHRPRAWHKILVVGMCLIVWGIPALFLLPEGIADRTTLLLAEALWLAFAWAGLVSVLNATRVELTDEGITQRRILDQVTIAWKDAVARREGVLVVISDGQETIRFSPFVFPNRRAMYAFLDEHLADGGAEL